MPQTSVHNLFPTPVWIVDFEKEVYEPLNAETTRTLEMMIGPRPALGVGATLQTDTNLHEFEEFGALMSHLTAGAEAVLAFLQVEYDNFEITGCWANINPVGGINTPHTHPNNYLSGVYYVRTTEGADSIFFSDPRPQASVILPPFRTESLYAGNEVSMEARPGRLLMFPAWLMHGVPPNRSAGDRISISFNIMFTGYESSMSKPMWQPSVRLKRKPDGQR